MHRYLTTSLLLTFFLWAEAQPGADWDNYKDQDWPPNTRIIHVQSSFDDTLQPVYAYTAKGSTPRPLIVSLHTWSGNFRQKDPIVQECIEKDFNYIHPDFRGPNDKPEACGSDLVIADIDDAIDWALKNMNVDRKNIHIIGVSGGGHATLVAYMKSKHTVKSFNAYVGIYNLVDWYYESLARGNIYAQHIAAATAGRNGMVDIDEARKRSPVFMVTPTNQRASSVLNLYCGLHDGYTGSVPISQTLELYNKIVRDFDATEQQALIPLEHRYTLLKRRRLDENPPKRKHLDRPIIYEKTFKGKINVVVFDGGHEMPEGNSLQFIH